MDAVAFVGEVHGQKVAATGTLVRRVRQNQRNIFGHVILFIDYFYFINFMNFYINLGINIYGLSFLKKIFNNIFN